MYYIVSAHSASDLFSLVRVCSNTEEISQVISKEVKDGDHIRIETYCSATCDEKLVYFIAELIENCPTIKRDTIEKLAQYKVIIDEKPYFLWDLPTKLDLTVFENKSVFDEINSTYSNTVLNLNLDSRVHLKLAIQTSVLSNAANVSVNIFYKYTLFLWSAG